MNLKRLALFCFTLCTSFCRAFSCVDKYIKFPNDKDYYTIDYNTRNAQTQNDQMNLVLDQTYGGTRLSLKEKLNYGRVKATLRVARGSNVISAFILMADNGDEIDFEWVGKDEKIIQSNFFYKGKKVYDVNALMHVTKRDLTQTFNSYEINWTPDYYEWIYNGVILRRLNRNSTLFYPDSPSYVQIGIWNASRSSWAGQGIDWSKAPFVVSIKDISVTCFGNTQPSHPSAVLPNSTSNRSITTTGTEASKTNKIECYNTIVFMLAFLFTLMFIF